MNKLEWIGVVESGSTCDCIL